MSRADCISAGALYLPLTLAIAGGMLQRRRPRQFAACLLGGLWALPALLALQALNLHFAWWTFAVQGPTFRAMPLELYLGWVILWGILPQFLSTRLPIAGAAALMVGLDLFLMPRCLPVVMLGPGWWRGEAVAAALVLLPALMLARWTLEESHLRARAALQVLLAAGLLLYLVPELAFALRPGKGWSPWLQMVSWQRQLALQLLLLLALPGLDAVAEFAGRGMGTPIPYDAPRRLVTSGIYRYCANPMQLSSGLAMLLWAALLRNGWLLAAALLSIAYSAGIAEWDEGHDLTNRFGDAWRQYRAQVRSWIPRWKPYHAGAPARLYVAATCGPCTEVRAWLQARTPYGLEIWDAESLPPGSIRRLRYDPSDGTATVDGVRALGRALEHLHLGWALAGAALRLPGVWQVVQLLMDASGFGPRDLEAPICSEPRDRKQTLVTVPARLEGGHTISNSQAMRQPQ